MSVKSINLGDSVISANTGLDAIKRAPIVCYPTSIRCLRIQDVSQSKDFHNWGYTDVDLKNYQKFQLRAGDIIVARTGNTVGVNRYINDDLPSVFNNGLIRLRINTKLFDSKFIYYNFKTPSYHGFIENISGGTSTQPNMQINTLLTMEIPLFSLPEQKAIASVLSSLDDKIDLLHRQNKTLESMAETLFRQWFINYLLPSDDCGCVGDLFSPLKGKNITKDAVVDGIYPVVAGGLEPSCYHNKYNTQKPVVTISASGANAGFVRLYYTNVWSSDSSYIDKSIFPYIYFSYMLLKINQKLLFDSQVGSAQPHVYPKTIMELKLSIPPISLIQKYENQVISFFNKIENNNKQIRKLSNLRDTLLPKLMSGEVRVQYAKE